MYKKENWEELFLLGRMGSFEWDVTTGSVKLSPSLKNLLGTTDDVLDLSYVVGSLVHPGDRSAMRESIKNALRTSIGPTLQFRAIRPDGSVQHLEGFVRVYGNDPGEVTNGRGIVRDITDQKQLEANLGLNEQKWKLMVDGINDVIGQISPELRYMYISPQCTRYMPLPPDEVIGRTHREIGFSEMMSRKLDDSLREVFRTQKPLAVDISVEFPDRSVDFEWRLSPQIDAKGVVRSIIYSARDVSARAEAERAIRKSDQQQQALLHAIPDSMYVLDREGIFLRFHNASNLHFPVKDVDIVGKSIANVFPLEIAERIMAKVSLALHTRQVEILEYEQLSKKGEVRCFESRFTIEGTNEVLAIVRDVTDLKLAEAKLTTRLRYLSVLHHTGMLLSEAYDIGSIGERILDAVDELLGWKRGSVWVIEEASGNLHLLAHARMGLSEQGLTEEKERVKRLVDPGGISVWVAREGIPIRLGNVKLDARYVEADPSIQSELCVPLKVGERTIGSINIESDDQDAFSEEDEKVLTTLAAQSAIALENARLFDRLQRELLERKQIEKRVRTLNAELEARVRHRTADLRKIVNAMAGREIRMSEMKETIKQLTRQIEEAGMIPIVRELVE